MQTQPLPVASQAAAAAADAYRRLHGLSPVPLRGKVPIGIEWPQCAALATTAEIARTFRRRVNLGLLCGDWSHVLPEDDRSRTWIDVLDVDAHPFTFDLAKHPAAWSRWSGATGLDVLADLESERGRLPDTWVQLTPSGGRHYVFRHPAGFCIPTRAGVWPGIDVRADRNGQIVAAPSIHPNGGRYAWEASSRPGEVDLEDWPGWLLALIRDDAPRRQHGPATGPAADSFLARCYRAAGWALGAAEPNGALACECPWLADHTPDHTGHRTGDGNDSSTALLPPNPDHKLGAFHCCHGHCETLRDTVDVLLALPDDALLAVAREDPAGFDLACSLIRRRA